MKQFLYKSTPTLLVQTVAFQSHPYAGGKNGCYLNQLPTLEFPTVAI